MKFATFLLAPCLALLIGSTGMGLAHAPPQVEVSRDNKKLIDLASTVAGKIPYGGPFLSMASKLIFAEEGEMSFVEMKKAWQDYTNEAIANERVRDLVSRGDGFKEILKQIDRIEDSPTADANKKLLREKWLHLETLLVKEIITFKSDTEVKDAAGTVTKAGSPARDTVVAYGLLINLHLDSYRRLIDLADDATQQATFISEYNFYLSQYLVDLPAEMGKASLERANDFTFVFLDDNFLSTGKAGNYYFKEKDNTIEKVRWLANTPSDQRRVDLLLKKVNTKRQDAYRELMAANTALLRIDNCGYAGVVTRVGIPEYAEGGNITTEKIKTERQFAVYLRTEHGMEADYFDPEKGGSVPEIRISKFDGIRITQKKWGPTIKAGDIVFYTGRWDKNHPIGPIKAAK